MKPTLQAAALAALLAVPAARADDHAPAAHAAPAAHVDHAAAPAAHAGPHWGYEGEAGPAHWGEANPVCKTGQAQSPINIQTKGKGGAKNKGLLPIGFRWSKAKGHLVNNGHTIQVNLDAGNSIDLAGVKYELLQFHFHTPSEHLVDGKHTPLEVHFVHKGGDKLAVVGLFIDERGAANAALAPVFKQLGQPGDLDVDLPAILPAKRQYFTYAGSLTTPPCSEGVTWLVMKERLHTSQASVREFKKIFPMNARPAQAIHARVIEADDSK